MTDSDDRVSADYEIRFITTLPPDAAFDVVTDVRAWWTGDIAGDTRAVDDLFTYRHEPQHVSTQRIVEAVPGERVKWRVEDAMLSFTSDPREWVGTEMLFTLTPVAEGTEVRFTHLGLVPEIECYEACSTAWAYYVGQSLRQRLDGRSVISPLSGS